MKLSDKILSSEQQIAGYRIQPYKAVTDVTAYERGNLSPVTAAPAVVDVAMIAAPIGSTVRGQKVVSGPRPQVIKNGAAAVAGNNSPRRR